MEQIESSLTNSSFRWVECQFEALKQCPKSERHLERCLKSLPRSLDETYERMLLNIDGASHEEARRILTLLCFSSRPLKVSELLHGIAVDLNEPAHLDRKSLLEGIDDLCEICPGLIDFGLKVDDDTISRSSEVTVRIAHFSVQEYLESDRIRQQKAGFFAMSSISAHQEIAAICCVYLLEPELSNADLTPAKLDDFPLAQFAAKFWYHHYQAGKGKPAQLSTLITKIFKQQHDQFATWIKLHDPVDGLQNTAVKFERILANVAPALYYASFLGLDWIIPEILLAGKTPGCKVEDVVNVQGGHYGNALQAASVGGHVETTRILVEQGADVNKQGGHCRNALQAASENGHVNIVEMLLSRGAKVNTKDIGCNALYAASERGHRKIIDLLVVAGADVNAYADGDYGYALQAASAKGHRGIVEMLIESGADINAQNGYNYPQGEGWCKCEDCCIADDDEFNTALQAASARGHREVVEILIDKGANVHIQGGPDGNALQAATKYGHQEIVRLLIEKGADVHALCGFSGSALQAAARHGHREIVQLLIEKGADVNALGGFSGYALQAAARHGDQEIVKLLIEKGANVNAQGGKIGYSLQAAARHGHLEIVKILIEKGADVNADSKLYGNAVQAASSGGYSEIIEVLLDNSADINAQGGAYGNALIAALWKGHSKVTKLLLERGADANAQDGRYGNALEVASARGRIEIIEMLVQKGAVSSSKKSR
jgi:ankyrin repeat protein